MAFIKSFYIICRYSFWLLLISGLGSMLHAQSLTVSPYSREGIGLVGQPSMGRNFAMGRMAYALNTNQNINFYNPASLASIGWTTFEVGGIGENLWLRGQGQQQTSYKVNFNHLFLAFPIARWWGATLGVIPYSKVGYDYLTDEVYQSANSVIPYQKIYSGSGGLNQVLFGHGFRIKKKWYIGFNFSYIFGDIEHQEVQQIRLSNNYNNSGQFTRADCGDIHFDFGVQYKKEFKNNWSAMFGMVFEPAQGLKAKNTDFSFTFTGNSGVVRVEDTVYYRESEAFSIDLPMKIGFGAMFIKSDRIRVGFDADYTTWSNMKFNSGGGLNDAYNIRIGGEHRGDDRRLKKRFGVRYGTIPMKVTNQTITEMAVSAGLGIPFRSRDKLSITEMNIGVEAGRRGQDVVPLFSEDFINVHVSLIVNNKWFIKRKYD